MSTEPQITHCTAHNCKAEFFLIPERAYPTLCLIHSDEQDRTDNGWRPENSID